jgi:hypothetical protein
MISTQRVLRSACVLTGILATSVMALGQCETWDTRFSAPGTTNGVIWCQAVFDDGTGPALVVGGDFVTAGTANATRIAKWNGSSWSALGQGFGEIPTQQAGPRALAVFDDGTGPALYAGGFFTSADGSPAANIARWDGTSWSPLGTGTNYQVAALCTFDDGSGPALYVAGYFTSVNGTPANGVARWNGSSWSAVDGGMGAQVKALVVFDDGTGPALYAGGWLSTAQGNPANRVAKWDGSSWTDVGSTDTNEFVNALAVHDDGSGPALYAAGHFTTIGGTPANRIAKWNGTAWSALGEGLSNGLILGSDPYCLASFDDGTGPGLFVGGWFGQAGTVPAMNIAKWSNSSWSALDSGVGVPTLGTVNTLGVFDEGSGPRLFAGGAFSIAGGVGASHIARWDGSSWTALSPGAGGLLAVLALTPYDDGSGPVLIAGGNFLAAGGVIVNEIGRWDGSSWSAFGAGIDPTSGTVRSLAQFDAGSGPRLFAAGEFNSASGVSGTRCIAAWNGAQWESVGGGVGLGAGLSVAALIVHTDATGPGLYAAGIFTVAGSTPANRIAKWNGSSWSALGSGLNARAFCLASFDDGSGPALYVGGEFTQAGGTPVHRIARWNGTNWADVGAGFVNTGTIGSPRVQSMTVFDDGSGLALYVSGYFDTAGGNPAAYIAKWNGSSWSPLGSGLNGIANALVGWVGASGPALYATGIFTLAGGVAVKNLARWDGSAWSDPGQLDVGAFALAVYDDGHDGVADLYVGGSFTTADGIPSAYIAERHGCAFGTFCAGDGLDPFVTTVCPCNNFGASGHGCQNSAGTGGSILSASGATIPDTVVLAAAGELPSPLSIFLQGNVDIASGVKFGDGVRCVGGSLKRLYAKSASGGAVSAPNTGAGELSVTARSAQLGDPIAHGSTRFYQVYYRDPNPAFCASPAGNTWNVSNGVRIVW